jgi:formate dehydrogenase subunit gamma
MADPAPALVHRFDARERTVHWLFAIFFLLLLLSGLGLWLPPGSNPVLDHRDLVRTVHLDAALGLLATIIPAMGRGSPLSALWQQVQYFTRDDWAWLRRVAIPAPLRRGPLPPQGRFNAGQKLNSIAIAASTVGFVVTGALMWQGEHLPTSLSEAADTWHLWLMVLVIPLIAGHLVLSLLLPSTRPALRGIVLGTVRADFARRRHARWAAETSTIPDATQEV